MPKPSGEPPAVAHAAVHKVKAGDYVDKQHSGRMGRALNVFDLHPILSNTLYSLSLRMRKRPEVETGDIRIPLSLQKGLVPASFH